MKNHKSPNNQNTNTPHAKPNKLSKNQPHQNPDSTNILKSINKLSLISFALFTLVLVIFILAIRTYCDVNSSWLGTAAMLAALIISIAPVLAILILTIKAIHRLVQYRKHISHIPLTSKILSTITLIELPILVFVYILGLNLRIPSIIATMQPTLNEHFPEGYNIIAYCEITSDSGPNSSLVMIKSSNYEKPVAAHFNWNASLYGRTTLYEDNYHHLKQADQLHYQNYINTTFGQNIISSMSISDEKIQKYDSLDGPKKNETYRTVTLKFLLPVNEMQDKTTLKKNISNLVSKYSQLYNDEDFNMDVYFADQINSEKIQDYYTFLNNSFDVCTPQPSNEIEKILKYEMSVHVYSGQDIQNAVEKGFSGMTEYLSLHHTIHYDY